ncbi:hypothetical protein ACFCV3_10020 [Kribbella sp. NPDC056345]|uniref:hypothetical protein n=1 Tax=Kribbella sp. NPDC056345 TaxID=3345789 RepID=UPI0035DDD343
MPILVSAALLLGATGVPSVAAEPPAPPAVAGNLTPIEELPVLDAADQAEKAAAKYAGSYAGAHWDAAAKVLYINLVQPKAKQADHRQELQAEISGRLAGSTVTTRYRSVPLSLDEQNALITRFMQERAKWGGKAAVDNVLSGSVDELTGRIKAHALTGAGPLQAAARKHFGNIVDITPGAAPEAQSRYANSGSYVGGMALWHSADGSRAVGTAKCTAGFNWIRHSDGLGYVSTAGHCAAVSDSIFQVARDQRVGYIGAKYLNDHEYVDFALVRITSGVGVLPIVYVGGAETTSSRDVIGIDTGTVTGVKVCSSGAITGLVCGTIATRTSSVVVDGTLLNRQTCVIADAGLTRQGDSGAPWITTYSPQAAKAWGQHTGTVDCAGNDNVDMVFSTVQNISARAGVTLMIK